MAMVNMNNLLNGKDSRWLQLEVCREFQRNKCTRPDTECKFAHPPANVEVQNGRVTACYDSIKGRCNREKPPCKYFHPPQHLKDQLLINGRNHLALKNALMQQMGLTPPGQPLIPGQVPAVSEGVPANGWVTNNDIFHAATNPYLTGMPQVGSTFSPYFTPGPVMPAILGPDPSSVASPLSVVPQTVVTQQKMARSDRLEPVSVASAGGVDVGKKRARDPSDDILLMDMKSVGSFYYESFAFPGMVPYKRPAADKSGMPVYQPNATTYQQLMQLQQPFVPVSCEYSSPPATVTSTSPSPGETSGTGDADAVRPEEDGASQAPATGKPQLTLPPAPPPDPATAAKEAAQQNYAKAMKMAAGINPLMALNYTGVALNKQSMAIAPPPTPRLVTPTTVPMLPTLQYAQHQPGLLAYARAPPPAVVPQYSILRPQMMHNPYAMLPQAHNPIATNGFINNVMAQYGPLTTSTASNNNIINSVTLQPYKKMKTT